jgi:putative transposase
MRGYKNRHIAEIVELDEHTVGVYIKVYREHGADALIPKKSPGPPKKLTNEQEKQLYDTISEKTPDDVGFSGMMNWTAKLACHWVEREFGVQYKINGMLDMFHRLDLSYTRPTYVLAKADPEKQAQFKEDFEALKKTAERGS